MKNKKLILGAFALLGIATVSAQDINPNDVPAELRTAFEQAQPNASDVEWEKEGENYKVEFDVNWQDHEIWYTSDASIVKTEKDIKKKELPDSVQSTISSKYSGYRVDSIEMTEENGSATYEVELEKGWDEEMKVVFDPKGKVLNEWSD